MKKTLCIIALLIAICIASGCLDDCTPVTKTSSKVIAASQQYSKIDLSPSSVDGTVGYSIQFIAKAYDNNGYAPNAKIEWVINRGDGIISSNGVFTPTNTGTVIVSAKAGNTISSALITVKNEPRRSRYYYNDYNDRDDYDYHYNNYYYNDDRTDYDDLCSREHNHGTSC
ncbi:hypothetical protein M0Q50_00045 [bacterium]|jgi:uncharacterized protein YxeA|nr:hypothetical protein [bacterium]